MSAADYYYIILIVADVHTKGFNAYKCMSIKACMLILSFIMMIGTIKFNEHAKCDKSMMYFITKIAFILL